MTKADHLWTLSRYTKKVFGYDYIGFPTYVNIAKDFFDGWARQHSGTQQPDLADFRDWYNERELSKLRELAAETAVQVFSGQCMAEVTAVVQRELRRRVTRVLPVKVEGKTARAMTLQEIESEYRQRLADEEKEKGK